MLTGIADRVDLVWDTRISDGAEFHYIHLSKHADRYQVGSTKMLAPTLFYKATPEDLIQSHCSHREITIDFIRIQLRLMLHTSLLPFAVSVPVTSIVPSRHCKKRDGNVSSNEWEVEYLSFSFRQYLFSTKRKILFQNLELFIPFKCCYIF